MNVKILLIFLASVVNLFGYELREYVDRIEDIHTNYYAGNFESSINKSVKGFINSLNQIEKDVLRKYGQHSIQYHYSNLLISLVLCDVAYVEDDSDERNSLITKIVNKYEVGFKASFNSDVFSDYFRALGELALNLISHDSPNFYSYVANGKRFLQKALAMDNENLKVNIPLALFYTASSTSRTFNNNLFAAHYLSIAEEIPLNNRQQYLKKIVKSSFLARINRRVEAMDCLKSAIKIFPNGYLAAIAIEQLKKGKSFF
ncbi:MULTISPECIES: hypothetical protein [unclassified Borrelia]|uniref:hypothetical protein n=1 Tax=unclassified Borrelia TaxID=2649934 RepID=UPI001E46D265|nr:MULTISPECIES: hypothetical protein [unclassified Borrelia]UGQ16581.1 hypothetical protein LSO06_04510 [Borrelia sp. RT5S]UGQ17749.1 hypothetical protein LSO05_04795 [Borrelia sp. RT1S]